MSAAAGNNKGEGEAGVSAAAGNNKRATMRQRALSRTHESVYHKESSATAYGVFDCEFDLDSYAWSCSYGQYPLLTDDGIVE